VTLDYPHHRNILVRILKDIYSDAQIGPFLGFKGGTAAYLLYDLSRFSVDLDFDLLDDSKTDVVFDRIKEIISHYGEVKEARKKRFTLFYCLSYDNKIDNAYNIKVEINLRDFGSDYEIKSYLGIPMKVMVKKDIAAHKCVAMLERIGKTNRDIFDVWFFLKNNWPINYDIVKKRTDMAPLQFLETCIKHLEALSDRNILSGIGELLDQKQKAWVKKNLRSETIFLLRLLCESLQHSS